MLENEAGVAHHSRQCPHPPSRSPQGTKSSWDPWLSSSMSLCLYRRSSPTTILCGHSKISLLVCLSAMNTHTYHVYRPGGDVVLAVAYFSASTFLFAQHHGWFGGCGPSEGSTAAATPLWLASLCFANAIAVSVNSSYMDWIPLSVDSSVHGLLWLHFISTTLHFSLYDQDLCLSPSPLAAVWWQGRAALV